MAFAIADYGNHESGFEEYIDITVTQYDYRGGSNYEFEVLETHPCSDAEIGLDNTKESKFYPLSEQDLELAQLHKSNFLCFDNSKVEI